MSAARAGKREQLDATDGRDLAVLALLRSQAHRGYVRDVLEQIAVSANATAEQTAFAFEAAMGVMRHRLTLRLLLRSALTGRWENIPTEIRHILLVGAYQLVWLERVPEYAAVSEAVRQGRQVGTLRLSRLVNAVLRSVQRRLVERVEWTESLERSRALRYEYDKAWLLDTDLFADPEQDTVGYLSGVSSLPTEIVARWTRLFGKQRTERICWASQWRPVATVRPNRLKTSAAELAQILQEDGVEATSDAETASVFVARLGGLRRSGSFKRGLCQVQDVTSQQAVVAGRVKPGMAVLDLCAGVGTKSTQAAELMNDRGTVVACDISTEKLDKVVANCTRLGLTIVRTVLADQLDEVSQEVGNFEMILVDAPCSNSGVFARRPEAKYRYSLAGLEQLGRQQVSLLERAISLAGAETRIVYSTCSLEPEENEQVIQIVAGRHADWSVAETQRFDPTYEGQVHSWRDGGYVAVLCPARAPER